MGFFLGAMLATAPLPAAAANLLAYYPLDSYYTSGGVPYTPNLVAGWGDAALQYSGGALYNGTISPGLIGNCYEETGTMARISFGGMDPFAATGSFTYALWVYDPFTTPSTSQTMLLSKQLANNNHYFRVILRASDDMQIGAYNGTTGSGTFQDRNTSAISPDPSARWTHIAVTGSKVGSTATWQVYADGQLLTMVNDTTILDATRAAIGMNLGQTAGGQNQGYPGVKVDDIRFYDGVLSQAEILTLIPEPSAITMLALGMGGLLLLRRRQS